MNYSPKTAVWPSKDLEEEMLERELQKIHREKRKRELRNAIARERHYETVMGEWT